jgi:hypothetical protein
MPSRSSPAQQAAHAQAWARLNQLRIDAESQANADHAATAQLTRNIEQKMRREATPHSYGVFAVGEKGTRRMVLRDVAELDGRPPISVFKDFGEALHAAGTKLDDRTVAPPRAALPDPSAPQQRQRKSSSRR